MASKIGAVVVTYQPELIRLRKCISAAKKQVNVLVIVDNGSSNVMEIQTLAIELGVEIVCLHRNLGIAAAQNTGIKVLKAKNLSWALTLDQDSVIPENTIQAFCASSHFNDDRTGILAAQYDDPSWTAAQRRLRVVTDQAESKRDRVISSGNLVRINAWEKVGGFDEWLFIDQVDYDFDAKLISMGYQIWQVNGVIMFHEIGQNLTRPIAARLFLIKRNATVIDHSAFRQYYIFRNTIVFSKRYPRLRQHRLQALVCLWQTRQIVLYKNHRIKKLLGALKGIIAGIKYHPSKDESFQNFIRK